MLLIVLCSCDTSGPNDLWNDNIHNAVDLWFSNQGSAEGTYGAIAAWNTAAVTSLAYCFVDLMGHTAAWLIP